MHLGQSYPLFHAEIGNYPVHDHQPKGQGSSLVPVLYFPKIDSFERVRRECCILQIKIYNVLDGTHCTIFLAFINNLVNAVCVELTHMYLQQDQNSVLNIVFFYSRGNLYRFDDFLTAWSEKLRSKEPTSMTVRLQKDVDKYKVDITFTCSILRIPSVLIKRSSLQSSASSHNHTAKFLTSF